MHHASSRSACQPEPVRAVVRPDPGFVPRLLGLLALPALPAVGQSTVEPLLTAGNAFDPGSATVLLALYFGMLLGLIGYNLLLYLALRERSILFYVLFAASFAGAMLGVTGLGNQYLWPPGGAWDTRALPVFITLANICALLFSRSFLDTAHQMPRWDHLLTLAIAILLATTLGSLLLPVEPLLQGLALVSAGNLLLLSLCGLDGMLHQVPAARIFLAAWLLLQCGAVLLALRIAGLLPTNPLTSNALLFGSALQMLLLSFALAARLNALKSKKNAAQAQSLQALQEQEQILERRVAERTEALAAANASLRERAMRDPLTGLANRMALRQHLEQAWQRARRRNELLALIMLDLDGFKPV
ncbi:MAG TPA: 7TM diverse intracellular signaling domain-containing protein, partial [Pseudomonas sp.]